MKCENCYNEHDGSFGSGRFCSSFCAHALNGKKSKGTKKVWNEKFKNKSHKVICKTCKNEFNAVKNRVYCSNKCRTEDGCSNITKIKLSHLMKGRYTGSNNPMYGRSPSPSKRTDFYSIKNNKSFIFKSSWEAKAAQLLEDDISVISYEYEGLKIKWGNNNNYFPDFQVNYNNGSIKIIEVKPKKLMSLWKNPEKLEALKLYANFNNILYETWTEDILFKNKSENSTVVVHRSAESGT